MVIQLVLRAHKKGSVQEAAEFAKGSHESTLGEVLGKIAHK